MNQQVNINTLNNPLIWSQQGSIAVDKTHPNIFLGGGVATPLRLSQAVPFDILGFILTAEQIKRELTHSHVFMLIADQHAWLANNFNKHNSKKIATNTHKLISRIIKVLKLKNWQVIKASEIFPDRKPKSYEELEIEDIQHFINHNQVGVKVGWKFSSSINLTHKTDEAHFDALLQKQSSHLHESIHVRSISSVFIKPGVTLDPNKPHESPYICTDPINRIIFNKGEVVSKKFSRKSPQINAVKNHLRNLCRLFEQLFEPFPPKTPLEEKIQTIINLLTI